jgi:CelD/BcsL family acetyltransferase involved in cellulose biosynthesis
MLTCSSRTCVEVVDPLADPRWRPLAENHPRGGIFHSPGWLTALRRSFGFPALAIVGRGAGADLERALLLCRVGSRLTGRRLVSLPFSDHCEPLVNTPAELDELLQASALADGQTVELRPLDPGWGPVVCARGWRQSGAFYYHEIDLRPGPEVLFRRFHNDCVRRKIRRSEREGLEVRHGSTRRLLDEFYRLHLLTRRRQGTPPQPASWFRHLSQELGERLVVYAAYQKELPVAALVTLRWGTCVTYKYGASDPRHTASGGTPRLFWEAIQDACALGIERMDLGRCDLDNEGLAQFKERLGGTRSQLTYYRRPPGRPVTVNLQRIRPILQRLPLAVFRLLGTLLYRHFG